MENSKIQKIQNHNIIQKNWKKFEKCTNIFCVQLFPVQHCEYHTASTTLPVPHCQYQPHCQYHTGNTTNNTLKTDYATTHSNSWHSNESFNYVTQYPQHTQQTITTLRVSSTMHDLSTVKLRSENINIICTPLIK